MINDGEIQTVSLLSVPNLEGGPQIEFRSSAFFRDAGVEIKVGDRVITLRREDLATVVKVFPSKEDYSMADDAQKTFAQMRRAIETLVPHMRHHSSGAPG
jgi:hypothetical protein